MKGLLSLLILSLAACSLTSAPPANFKGEWTPLNILERSAGAYGGLDEILRFQDMTVEQEIAVYQGRGWIKGTTLLRFKPPDLIYEVLRFEGGDEKIVYHDGESAGEWINGALTGRDVEADLKRRRRQILIHGLFMEDGARHTSIDMRADLEGVDCVVLEREAGGERWKIWIDLHEYLIRKIGLTMPASGAAVGLAGKLTIDWYFSDFRWAGKRLVPYAFLTFINRKPFQKGEVKTFSLNSGIPPGDFTPVEEEAPSP